MPHQTQLQATLHSLQQQLKTVLQQPQGLGPGAAKTIKKITQRLSSGGNINHDASAPNPLADLLTLLTPSINNPPEQVRSLAASVLQLADHLPWYLRPVANNPEFMVSHANAQIIGPQGLVIQHDLMVGVTLMRPNMVYPDHQHEPEEIYLVLTAGHWRQTNLPWHTPGLGGLVYNASDLVHGMKSLNTPLLALWCLPLDKPFTSFGLPLPLPLPTS
jgi:hypothetical protein